jgi:WD40 repeat protein
LINLSWQGQLNDYITDLDWSPDGRFFSASSAAGEAIVKGEGELIYLRLMDGTSIERVRFSQDGRFLAAGGQIGQMYVWEQAQDSWTLVTTRNHANAWIDRISWHPQEPYLAYSLGKYVQIWDAQRQEVLATLNFERSTVLDLAWHPAGTHLAVAGYQGVEIWQSNDWDTAIDFIDTDAAISTLAWSPQGNYLATGNLDRTVTVIDLRGETRSLSWIMRGFPGKIRQLTWIEIPGQLDPDIVVATADLVVVWNKINNDANAWEGSSLEYHYGIINGISVHHQRQLLASAAEDNQICIWQQAEELVQVLHGAPTGWSTLAWQPQGQKLVAGGCDGGLFLW